MIKPMSEGSIAWLHAARRAVCLLEIDYGAWRWPLLCVFQQCLDRRVARSAHQTGFPIVQLSWHPILIEKALHFGVAANRDQIRDWGTNRP
jgi:hypothetical protein